MSSTITTQYSSPNTSARPGYEVCTGCGICQLPCPVWRRTRDVTLTLHGRARALQAGASAEELAESLMACVLCGACEAVCPEDIDTVGMTLDLRAQLAAANHSPLAERVRASSLLDPPGSSPAPTHPTVLLPGRALRGSPKRLERTRELLAAAHDHPVSIAGDDGADIAAAIEAGLQPEARPLPARALRFTKALERAREIVAADGLLHRVLRAWLPGVRVLGIGEALLRVEAVRAGIRGSDLYVVESRAYHADFARLVGLYDALRADTGCAMNLDLQRAAISTGATGLQHRAGMNVLDPAGQALWIAEGQDIERVVVECVEDIAPFECALDVPVVHLSDVADADVADADETR